jgi:hypothetical protein
MAGANESWGCAYYEAVFDPENNDLRQKNTFFGDISA